MDRTDGGCVGGVGQRAGGTAQDPHEGAFAEGLGWRLLLADRCTPESEQNLLDLVAMGQVTLLDDSVRNRTRVRSYMTAAYHAVPFSGASGGAR